MVPSRAAGCRSRCSASSRSSLRKLVARLALDHPLASYGLLIAPDDYATHEERFQFFYRPDKKRFDQPSGESFTAMFKKVVVLSEDKKTASLVNDGIYKDSLYEFKVQNVGTVRPYSSQGRTGVVLPIVVAFARRPPESKINTSDVGWVTPAINRDYNLLLPFEAEP